MKKIKNLYRLKIALILLIGITIQSCKKFVDIKSSPDLINSSAVFSDAKTALSAVEGVYIFMRTQSPSLANGTLSIYSSLSSDELYNTATVGEYGAFFTNSILPASNVINNQIWTVGYKTIYRANAIIEGLMKSTLIADSVKQQLIGEMKIVRAMEYFYMVNLFGDIPLVTSTDYQINASIARTPSETIYQKIINDLLDAKQLLKSEYPSINRCRPNRWTAAALLSRVYLFHGEWANSEQQATDVLNSGIYTITNNLNNVFLINSNETIWQISRQNESGNSTEGGLFIPSSSSVLPAFSMTSHLLSVFETGDLRKANWTKTNTVSSQLYSYPFKYKSRTSTPVLEYNVVLRLAEQYLIRAEARVRQNTLAEAQADLNVIRTRAGLLGTTAVDQNSILLAIYRERQSELFCEWGHRWLDLKRSNRSNLILSPIKGSNWQLTDTLYPIPFNEIQYNPLLIQNPGY